jgi:uncharacterized protein (DUF1697 family)
MWTAGRDERVKRTEQPPYGGHAGQACARTAQSCAEPEDATREKDPPATGWTAHCRSCRPVPRSWTRSATVSPVAPGTGYAIHPGVVYSRGVTRYVVLLRGINVGGKNPVPMAHLRAVLGELGYADVVTYIASGNIILSSSHKPAQIKREIEAALPTAFTLHSELVGVLVLTATQLRAVVANRPTGFGDEPDRYHSDAIFLMGIDATAALEAFHPRDGVDTIWPGDGVIYSQRLSAQRTKSRLNKVMGSPVYRSMTIRSWATTTKLAELATD